MDAKFLRFLAVPVAILLLGTESSLLAQTMSQLLRENKMLRARIETMEYQFIGSQGTLSKSSHKAHDDHDDHHHDHADESHGPDAHDAIHGNGRCEPHFDYYLKFDDHHGGHGHSDLCGCRCGSEHGSHGHDHHAHGPAYHHSFDGYPILHSPRTEFFFVERHVHLRLGDVRGADDGEVDELEFEAELVYALNDRLVLIGTAPLIHLTPFSGSSTTGIGDLKFGLRLMAFNGERDGVLFGMDVVTPTGDPDRDLGGDTLLAPSVNWVHDFGCGTYMFNVSTWEMPVDVDQPEDHFLHDFVLLHTFLETRDAALFRYLTTSFEINMDAVMNGPTAGQAVVDATCGLTWVVGDENEVSVGWSFPISGDRNFDNQFLFNFIKHL